MTDHKINPLDPDEATGVEPALDPFAAASHNQSEVSSLTPAESYEGLTEVAQDNAAVLKPAPSGAPGESEGSGFWRAFYHDKKLFYTTLTSIVFVLAAAGSILYFLFGRDTPLPPPDVKLNIQTPSRVVAGQAFEFEINYSNRSQNTLADLQAGLVYPLDFSFRESTPASNDTLGRVFSLPDLALNQTGSLKIKGLLEGQVGDKKEIQAALTYKIEGHRAVYRTTGTVELTLSSPDLSLTVIGPSEALAGQKVVYNFSYQNISDKTIHDVALAVSLASEFEITEANPGLGSSLSWLVGDIAPGQTGSLRVAGVYNQAGGLQRIVELTATSMGEVISRALSITEVSEAPVIVNQTVSASGDNAVEPGETVTYTIGVENRSQTTLTNLVIATTLTGNAYDQSSLRTTGGILSGQIVTWTPGGVNTLKALRPGETVSVDFSIRILNPPTQTGQKTLTVASRAQATSFEFKEPVSGPELVLKIKTAVDHTQDVTFESGAWPLQAERESRFRVSWRVRNTTNALIDAKVEADLPLGGASFVRGETNDGSIDFLSGPYAVVWNIGTLSPHSIASSYFIVSVTPSVADRGKAPVLANNVLFQGFDSFINQSVLDETPVGAAVAPGAVQ